MKPLTLLSAALITGLAVATAAAPMKPAPTAGKRVTLYQTDKCHMYYSAAQAKKYNYICPGSKSKMKKVTVSAAVAKLVLAKTNAALAPQKPM